MPTLVRGLLLVNTKGHRYFIEGGIKANRLTPIGAALNPNQPDVSSLKNYLDAIANDQELKNKEKQMRNEFEKGVEEYDAAKKENLGPRLFAAFNVFLEREDDGGDSEITGNGHTLSQS